MVGRSQNKVYANMRHYFLNNSFQLSATSLGGYSFNFNKYERKFTMKNFDLKNVDCHATLAMIEKRWGFPRRTLRALLGMTKSGQSRRSLLPESGADAPAILSAVYPDSTPAKNRQADVPQYGRSMIEMLGVLAIIGVLSVGGIAGYSKAMMKYRINKTIEQITLIAGNVRAFFGSQKNYAELDNCWLNNIVSTKCQFMKKAKLIPDEMWREDGIETLFSKVANWCSKFSCIW